MKKYRVLAECVTTLYLDVDAENEAQAYDIANDTDGGDFTELPDADWQIISAEEIK